MRQNYQGIECESDSEMFIIDWLLELKSKGFIHSIERAGEYRVSSGLRNKWVQRTQLKTKVKEESKEQILIGEHYYTPEFIVFWYEHTPEDIIWNIHNLGSEARPPYALIAHPFPIVREQTINTLEGQLTAQLTPLAGMLTYIEVKPDQDFQNMTRAFMINKAWMWESRKMFINLMKPKQMFKSTFTPQAYIHTRVKRTEREIKWPIKTVDQYLQSIGYETQTTPEPLENRQDI